MFRDRIRARSLKQAQRLGYAINRNLPSIDPPRSRRSVDEVADRLCSLHVVVSCAYGFQRAAAWSWLQREDLVGALSPCERAYLECMEDPESDARLKWQVEALWALSWAAGVQDELDFALHCADDLVHRLPDLRTGAPTAPFRASLALRRPKELLRAADLAYCLHWAVVDAHLHGRPIPGAVEAGVVLERRRALEWLIGDDAWDDVQLDT